MKYIFEYLLVSLTIYMSETLPQPYLPLDDSCVDVSTAKWKGMCHFEWTPKKKNIQLSSLNLTPVCWTPN